MTAQETTAVTISGVGHHLPVNVESNEALCRNLDVTPDWILEKTGIEQRYIAGPDDTASSYAVAAGERALSMAGVPVDEIDLIVVGTKDGLTMIEEGMSHPTEIVALTATEFHIRSHNPGQPVDIRLEPATATAPGGR